MKKLRCFDLKGKGVDVYLALCDLERKLDEIGLTVKHVDEDDEYFKDKVFVTDAIWSSRDGVWGMTFEPKERIPKILAFGYMRMLLWFAKHGAYEQ